MKIKRYFAANMRQAMMLVREEHGDDAVILSTKDVDGGVEIVAAMDPEANQYQQEQIEQQASSSFQSRDDRNSAAYHSDSVGSSASNNPRNEPAMAASQHDITRMAEELSTVRSMLENQLSGLAWGQTEHTDPHKITLIKKLMQLGIGWDLSEKMVKKIPKVNSLSWGTVLDELQDSIQVEERDIIERGGIIALVGPTGVGKTTTIAKLASRFVMRNSTNDIAIISTDSYKIGAQAQLQHFADLINVPLHVAKTQGELYALLTSMTNKKLVLVDTAGMSQRDLQLSQQITSGHNGLSSVKNYLVVSAATQRTVLEDIVKSFSQVVLQGCILTKVDEALQLGNVLTVLIEEQLPIAYMSSGQRVPEDLEKVRAKELMDKAIFLGQQNNNSKEDEQAFQLGMGKEISNAQ